MTITGTVKCDICGATAPAVAIAPYLTYPTGWIQLSPSQWADKPACAQQYYTQIAAQPAA